MITSSNTGRDDWQGALAARYPLARSVGFECFGGWQPILAHIFEPLEPAVAELPADSRRDFHIEGIRQKFGRLQVRLSDEGTAEMRAAIEEAESASEVGSPRFSDGVSDEEAEGRRASTADAHDRGP